MSEHVFTIPNIDQSAEHPAIQRHYALIREAMIAGEGLKVGNRQLRLLKAGIEIPITLKQCNRLLEKYEHAS